jgi:hypothetical protein
MKKHIALIAILSCVLVLALCCCKKKSASDGISGPGAAYHMTATIVKPAGAIYFVTTGIDSVTAVKSNDALIISATDGKSGLSRFTFKLAAWPGPGLSIFDSISTSYGYLETNDPAYAQTRFAVCTLEITKTTGERVYGTFRGRLTDGSVVTDGDFTASRSGF